MFEHRPFGKRLKLAVRGASHAPAMAFRLEGLPADEFVDRAALAAFLERRAPGRDPLSTTRREADAVQFVSGLDADGLTDGAPIEGRIVNADCRPADYGAERTVPRPGHADYGQWVEAGAIPTGGGANSGRLTALLCAAGGICRQVLAHRRISVSAEIVAVGGKPDGFEETIRAAQKDGDSVGGVVRCRVEGLRPGLGGALFAGVESELSAALFAIPGVKGVAFGNGFDAAALRGSENDDPFRFAADGRVVTASNRHGGILGGRTTGMPLVFDVAFKPTPTVFKPLPSVDLAAGKDAVCAMKGRHDPCIVRRAVPVVEAVAAFALLDELLAAEAARARVCLVLTGHTLDEDFAQYVAERPFADLVELRVDALAAEERSRVAAFPMRVDVPVVLTFRRKCDGGLFEGPEAERAAFFRAALAAAAKQDVRFAYVDFEDDFRDAALVAAARAAHVRVIRSLHVFDGPVKDVVARCRTLRGATREIPKIAFQPTCAADLARFFDETKDFDAFPHVLCVMGPLGFASRALAVRSHSLFTYASTGALVKLGHVSPRELVRTYRIRTVTRDTALYGVTGWPLVFTRSPELHNAAFAAADDDAVLAPFPAETSQEALALMRTLPLEGLAVTYPHKLSIVPLLDALGPEAEAIGAVNTVVREGARLVGRNTDALGFSVALRTFLGVEDLAGRRVAVVGAGGAARAVVWALVQLHAEVCVFNRTRAKADALAAAFGCRAETLGPETADVFAAYADVVVQCAAPGGDPAHFDPLAWHRFTGRECVYDLVYEPALTPTLSHAQAAGCRVENGLSMLAAQAREQRRLWSAAHRGFCG